jgi:mono/diheme cytochrome c family protein
MPCPYHFEQETMMHLTRWTRHALSLALVAAALGHSAMAQQRTDPGKREFDSNCASCHGADGKGGGIFVEYLRRSPPDLSQLSKRNGGVFPITRVYEVIEGAGAGHGTRDMPIWGRDYRIQAAEYYVDAPYNAEAYVRARILALAEYINRLQVK